ncbi:MAG: transcriptional regulator, TetR family [Paenibacillus sp.]|nr:transcriptional regulator, TetR family [Paenibacillus sp.]
MSRDKIIRAAVEAFAEKGFHQASMDDIALRAKVAKGTLYYHFTGKSQLFQSIVSDGLRQLRARIESDLVTVHTLEQQIRRIVGHHTELFVDYHELAHIVFHELSNGIEEEVRIELSKQRDAYIAYVASLLKEAQKMGAMREIDCGLAAAGMLGLLDSSCSFMLRHQERISREQVEAFVVTTLRSGILKQGRDES